MVEKTNAASDAGESIIELTDIIERGAPPSSLPDFSSTAAASGPASPGNAGESGDDDLDALLAEIEASPADSSSAEEQPIVNPNETLDMPDMKEVESFLDELKIPSRIDAAPEARSGENLDDVVDRLAGGGPRAEKTSRTLPLSEIDELDALLNSPARPAPQAAPEADLPASPPEPSAEAETAVPQAGAAAKPFPASSPPLPAQWDSLLGAEEPEEEEPAPHDLPEQGDMPPHLVRHLERIDAELERLRALSSPASPPASFDAETACAALRKSGEETERRVRALEETLRNADAGERIAALASEVRQSQETLAAFASEIRELRESVRSVETRLEETAARLEKAGENSKDELERAAAAAAARIIREELAAVLKDA
jgi:hypothetical protein